MKPGDSVEAYCDITDGSIFRAHPELGVDADRSDGAVRLAFILYYDEVEVTNALGGGCVHRDTQVGLILLGTHQPTSW